MSNFKLIKTAAALALGASVVTSAVVPADASAASKYKVKNGKLVIAKTGKKATGTVTFNKIVYKNGVKLTGLKGKVYYKAGKKATGTYKGAYYVSGAKKVTTGTYNKAYYVKGVKKVTTGLYASKYYKSGKLATATYKGAYYVNGVKKVTTGTYNKAYYVAGKKVVSTGTYNKAYYVDGVKKIETGLLDGVYYVDGAKATGTFEKAYYVDGAKKVETGLFEDKFYFEGALNVGSKLFDGKLYKDVALNSGLIAFEDKVYNGAILAEGTFEYEGKEEAFEAGVKVGAKVSSVTAINANEFLVTTNRTLSKDSAENLSNYEVFLNGSTTTDVIKSAKLQEDGKSVLVRFTTAAVKDQSLKLTAKSLLTADFNKVQALTTEVKLFADATAPTLKSVAYDGADVIATFTEPVTSIANIRIEGVTATLGAQVSDVAGNYSYKLTSAPTTAGTYSVVFSQLKDANNNETGTQTGSYTIIENADAPTVSKVESVTSNSFKVTFDKAIVAVPTNLVVKKGALQLATTRVTAALAGDGKSVVYTITTSAADEVKLFDENEATSNLSVSFDGYKDANGLLGKAYAGNVALTKDVKAPALLSKNLVSLDATKTVITLTFDEAVDSVTAKNAEIVIKKDGIVQSTMTKPVVADVAVGTDATERTVTLTFATTLTDGEYELVLPKGLVKDKELNENAADTINVKVSSAVTYFLPTVTAPTTKENVIKVTSTKDLTDSAKELSNYTIDDAALPAGTTIDFVDDKKNVEIKLPETFAVSTNANYKFIVSDKVKDVDGASAAANAITGGAFTQQLGLKDNVAPTLKSAILVADTADVTKFNKITLTFSEALQAIGSVDQLKDFVVTVNGSEVPVNAVTLNTDTKKVDIVIGDGTTLYAITQPTVVKVAPVSSTGNTKVDIKDVQGNELTTGTSVTATK